jgi:DNA-directed RNA polymerase sigma subunit (sigma70/sigma32)
MFTINDSSRIANLVKHSNDEQGQLIGFIRSSNKHESETAKEILINSFQPATEILISYYDKNKTSKSNLLKAANRGLVKAAETYHTSEKYRFAVYALWFMRAEIHRLIGLPIDPENIDSK